MGIVSKPNTFSANTTIKSSEVNDNFDTIYNEFNGSISASNLASNAVTTAKITDGDVTTAKLDDQAVTPAKVDNTLLSGWIENDVTVSAVTLSGNHKYTLTVDTDLTDILSPGMPIRTTRTVAAPTQSLSLDGSTQYLSKSSPSGMTFTDDFTVMGWIKLKNYDAAQVIYSRSNGSSGWAFYVETNGKLTLKGFNGGGSNHSEVVSVSVLPLGEWIHVAGCLDMSAFSTSSSWLMVNGVNVDAYVSRAGTNPTSLVQAGDLEVGSWSGGLLKFAGNIAQVAVFSAKLAQSTVQGYMSQGLSGTETSFVSGYSLSNSLNDLNTTNANNLTATGSATTTNDSSPFGTQGDGSISSTLDYAKVKNVTSTTVTVQVANGCTIPTSGGVSAIDYSISQSPYQFPTDSKAFALDYSYAFTRGSVIDVDDVGSTGGGESIILRNGILYVNFNAFVNTAIDDSSVTLFSLNLSDMGIVSIQQNRPVAWSDGRGSFDMVYVLNNGHVDSVDWSIALVAGDFIEVSFAVPVLEWT